MMMLLTSDSHVERKLATRGPTGKTSCNFVACPGYPGTNPASDMGMLNEIAPRQLVLAGCCAYIDRLALPRFVWSFSFQLLILCFKFYAPATIAD
jgi:hypothetical protein